MTMCWGPATVVGFMFLTIFVAFVPIYYILLGCFDFCLGSTDYDLLDAAKSNVEGVEWTQQALLWAIEAGGPRVGGRKYS